jgi:beta-lactamase regulating signal transducer with metallopeptidase domain
MAAPASWTVLILPALLAAGVVAWALGALWVVMRAAMALVGLERLRRRSTEAPPESFMLAAAQACELRFSEDCPGPMTWGVIRPVILLPWAALRWSPARREAVMRHELAHVRRRDGLMQALALLACALYWPNPMVWRAAQVLRREAEVAADDAVIAAGVRPSDYASELLELAREWRGQRQVFAGMAMAAPAALTERVQSILSPNAQRTGATAMDTLKLVGIGILTTAALAIARPCVAQTAPPAPPGPAIAVKPLAAPAAPAAPAPPAPFRSRDHQIDINGDRTVVDGQVRRLTPEEKAALDRELAEIGPTVNKAIADAHIQERVAKQVAAENARTQAEVARQMAEIGPTIQKAMADAKVSEQVAKRMAEIQPRIDAALAKAQAAAEKGRAAAERAREQAGQPSDDSN